MSGNSEKKRKGKQSSGEKTSASRRAAAAAREAARHSRTRHDHKTEIAEDYVELIAALSKSRGEARTVEIAERLGVSHVTVTKTIRRLAKEGLVTTEPYRSIFLTDKGEEIARHSAERHAIVLEFLKRLGVDDLQAEIDAEGIEHHVSEQTLAAMKKFVDHSQDK
ncbi:MAG: manganese-binding transcriptional regulator MntR [Phycisphaerae bacterium]